MSNSLEIIESLGINTTSSIKAVRELGEQRMSITQYDSLSTELLQFPEPVESSSVEVARLFAMYAIQEIVNNPSEPVENIREVVIQKHSNYVTKNGWAIKVDEDEDDSTSTNSRPIRRKRKKGEKRDNCERIFNQMKGNSTRSEIIQAFIDKAEMTKAGATTYFHNCKAKFGYGKKDSEKKERKETKRQGSRRLWKVATDHSKEAIMLLFQKELNTSVAGSQTYYYECKKELE